MVPAMSFGDHAVVFRAWMRAVLCSDLFRACDCLEGSAASATLMELRGGYATIRGNEMRRAIITDARLVKEGSAV